jgi:hypothetical protein
VFTQIKALVCLWFKSWSFLTPIFAIIFLT